MPIVAFLVPIISWIFRAVVIKFVVLTGIFAFMAVVVPLAIGFLVPFVSGTSLTSAFSSLDAGTWFWLDFLSLGYGLPLVISAYIARFLIRRLPVIG